jgi:GT2 family glycosyltransferase
MLALEGVDEVIVVDDGSTDDTAEVCGAVQDTRLKLIRHPHNMGVATARNTGADAATGTWVMFGEDDCRFPSDYALALRGEGRRASADIIGAPMLHIAGNEDQVRQLAAEMPRLTRAPTMDDSDVFPLEPTETPFLPATVLVRRAVFERVRFFEGFRSNGYREETDFFVQAARAGFRGLLTPATFAYQLETWGGGQHHSSPLRYEFWTLRNNWLFLQRHGRWLADQGFISGVISSQARFTLRRARVVLRGVMSARLARLRAVVARSTDSPRS